MARIAGDEQSPEMMTITAKMKRRQKEHGERRLLGDMKLADGKGSTMLEKEAGPAGIQVEVPKNHPVGEGTTTLNTEYFLSKSKEDEIDYEGSSPTLVVENNDGGMKGGKVIMEEEVVDLLSGHVLIEGAENPNGLVGNNLEGLEKKVNEPDINNIESSAGIKSSGPIQIEKKEKAFEDWEQNSAVKAV
ncbi:hypothetical protein L6452_05061 [Arctium lappa]|uniref:Uncharacterized protein n=1 Tax=Arctium lappa TaxID=4217 RepID=A0ACB9EFM2_ARCLA|nr:hypothetical protein L6452_05061 [Arctium lappa]